MLSKRNLAMMLTMFGIVLLLFLSTVILKEYFNDYEVNHAAQTERITLLDEAQPGAAAAQHVVYVGAQDTGYYRPVQEWARYRKLSYEEAADALAGVRLAQAYQSGQTYLLLDGSVLETDPEPAAQQLLEYVRAGGVVVFCTLPAYQTLQNSAALTELLGIQNCRGESATLQEIRLYEGFLLGGEVHYSFDEDQIPERIDMDRQIPWYDVSARTKSYMVGYIKAAEKEALGLNNEDMPAMLWRCSSGSGCAFAVNGNYMEGAAALGILDAVVYESSAYALYAVVNAQNLSVTGFPDLTNENEAEFTQKYGFNSQQFCRDILWPSLVAAAQNGGWKITAFFTTRMDQSSMGRADMDGLIDYLKYFNEETTETGLCLGRRADADLRASLQEEASRLDALGLRYPFTGAYIRPENEAQLARLLRLSGSVSACPGLRTVVGEYDPQLGMFSRLTEQITRQSVTLDGYRYTYQDDFRTKSLQTSLGYSNVQADIYRIIWPQTDADAWEIASEKLASHIDTYWKPFSVFEKTTITESDRRLRLFWNETVTSSAAAEGNGQTITIRVEHFEQEAWLMLRTHGEEILAMEGGSWEQIETDAYLLHLTAADAAVRLGTQRGTHYYDGE